MLLKDTTSSTVLGDHFNYYISLADLLHVAQDSGLRKPDGIGGRQLHNNPYLNE